MKGTVIAVNAKRMTAKVEVWESNKYGGMTRREYTIKMNDPEEFEELDKVEVEG